MTATPFSRSTRFLLVLALVAGATGCPTVPSTIDASDPRVDAGAHDGGSSDGSVDAARADASDGAAPDAPRTDAGDVDASSLDAGDVDTGRGDAGAADAGVVDGGEIDAGTGDAGASADGGSDGGVVAPDSGMVCPSGFASCVMGEAECARDLRSDPLHCGSCGAECPRFAPFVSHVVCDVGVCRIDACAVGFADADGDPVDGCEAPSDYSLAWPGSPTPLRIPRGSAAPMRIDVVRQNGFTSPVTIRALGLPSGVGTSTAVVNGDYASFVLTADAAAPLGTFSFSFEGREPSGMLLPRGVMPSIEIVPAGTMSVRAVEVSRGGVPFTDGVLREYQGLVQVRLIGAQLDSATSVTFDGGAWVGSILARGTIGAQQYVDVDVQIGVPSRELVDAVVVGPLGTARFEAAMRVTHVTVSTTGSDSANGDALHPFRTLTQALGVGGDGVHIDLRPGRYSDGEIFASGVTNVPRGAIVRGVPVDPLDTIEIDCGGAALGTTALAGEGFSIAQLRFSNCYRSASWSAGSGGSATDVWSTGSETALTYAGLGPFVVQRVTLDATGAGVVMESSATLDLQDATIFAPTGVRASAASIARSSIAASARAVEAVGSSTGTVAISGSTLSGAGPGFARGIDARGARVTVRSTFLRNFSVAIAAAEGATVSVSAEGSERVVVQSCAIALDASSSDVELVRTGPSSSLLLADGVIGADIHDSRFLAVGVQFQALAYATVVHGSGESQLRDSVFDGNFYGVVLEELATAALTVSGSTFRRGSGPAVGVLLVGCATGATVQLTDLRFENIDHGIDNYRCGGVFGTAAEPLRFSGFSEWDYEDFRATGMVDVYADFDGISYGVIASGPLDSSRSVPASPTAWRIAGLASVWFHPVP